LPNHGARKRDIGFQVNRLGLGRRVSHESSPCCTSSALALESVISPSTIHALTILLFPADKE
jgi:hypothetical protein